jgi:L-glyceraldehyde 3-phosphate reductase
MTYLANNQRYQSMQYRRCGNSGLKLPLISLGLWQNFGSLDVFENSKQILHRAFDLGITHFDLANNYGPIPGSAEETLGKVLKSDFKNYRDEMVISTKAGYKMWEGPYGEFGSRKYLISSLDQSLKRLNLEYVDIFYSHRPDYETPLEETMNALADTVKQGKALYVGISNYDHEYSKKAIKILQELNTPCLLHQARYSIFDRWVEGGLLNVLESEQIGMIAYSPLAQGLLTDRYLTEIPKGSRIDKTHGTLRKDQLSDDILQKIHALKKVADDREQTLSQMAIAWLLHKNQVTSVLVGVSSVEQLEQNHATLKNLSFTQSELDTILNII